MKKTAKKIKKETRLVMDGEIWVEDLVNGKVTATTPIENKVVLQCLLRLIEHQLRSPTFLAHLEKIAPKLRKRK